MEHSLPKSPWRPLKDGLVCVRAQEKQSLIALPEGAAQPVPKLEVIACGPDCKGVKVGDRVLIGKDVVAGKYRVGGTDYLMLTEEFVYFVWEEEP